MPCVSIEVEEVGVCTEGKTKCIGNDLYICQNGTWVLYQSNASECVTWTKYLPYMAIGGAVILAIALARR